VWSVRSPPTGSHTQFYFGGTPARVQSDIHQITGSAVGKVPTFARLQPHALAGAGALVFNLTGSSGGSFAGATLETKAVFVYDVGAEYAFTRHFSLRSCDHDFVCQIAGRCGDGWLLLLRSPQLCSGNWTLSLDGPERRLLSPTVS
jgi:hypothetical protein